jgi:hypothetical protein
MLQYERFYDDCALLAREVFKEEVTEEIKLSIFSADASCSQHNLLMVYDAADHPC